MITIIGMVILVRSENDSDDITKTKQTNKETNRNNSTDIQMKTETDYTHI